MLVSWNEHHIRNNVMVTNMSKSHAESLSLLLFVVSSVFIRGPEGGGQNLPGGVPTNVGVAFIQEVLAVSPLGVT